VALYVDAVISGCYKKSVNLNCAVFLSACSCNIGPQTAEIIFQCKVSLSKQ